MDADDNGKTGHRERLRERFLHGDDASRTDEALLELLLTFGILNQIGAVEEERIEEALSKLTSLLRTAIKNAKAKHGAGKRVRVLFRLENEKAEG